MSLFDLVGGHFRRLVAALLFLLLLAIGLVAVVAAMALVYALVEGHL